VINFLLTTEIIPLCLRIMETGSELSKTVATFIVQKILLDDMGLQYICATAEVCIHTCVHGACICYREACMHLCGVSCPKT
jgi:hypothetical protein